jgi:hypothetical protein
VSTHDPSRILLFAQHYPLLTMAALAAAGVWICHERAAGLLNRGPQNQATAREWAGVLFPFPLALAIGGALLRPGLALIGAAVLLPAAAVAWPAARRYRSRHQLDRAVHQAVRDSVGHREGTPARKYLSLKPDGSVRVRLTPEAASHESKVKHIMHAVPQAAGMGEHVVERALDGRCPVLTFRLKEKPVPIARKLSIREILPKLAACAGPKTVVVGLARGASAVEMDFARVVHMLISAATGIGKSNLVTFVLMQFLFKGAVAVIVDPTGISYPWAQSLPNVFYAQDDEDMRRACYWIDREIKRRTRLVNANADISGFVEGGFGPDIIVVPDEKNLAERRLTADWQARGGKGRDPALRILDDVHFAGRKIGVHAVMAMVRADAAASGGGTVRGQAGLIAFGASPKSSEWNMLFRGEPVPVCSDNPVPQGRMQMCALGEVHEVQVPHCLEVPRTAAERPAAMELARQVRDYSQSGTITPVPADLLESAAPQPGEDEDEYVDCGAGLGERRTHTHRAHENVTLREAIDEGLIAGLDLSQLRNKTRSGFPEPAGERGKEKTYLRPALLAWEAQRTGQEPEADIIPINRVSRKENA